MPSQYELQLLQILAYGPLNPYDACTVQMLHEQSWVKTDTAVLSSAAALVYAEHAYRQIKLQIHQLREEVRGKLPEYGVTEWRLGMRKRKVRESRLKRASPQLNLINTASSTLQ